MLLSASRGGAGAASCAAQLFAWDCWEGSSAWARKLMGAGTAPPALPGPCRKSGYLGRPQSLLVPVIAH